MEANPGRARLIAAIEAIAVSLLSIFTSPLAEGAAAALGITLPKMPLIERAYLHFLFALLLVGYVLLRGEKLRAFGLARPKRWLVRIGQGVALLIVVLAFDIIGRPIIDPIVAKLTHTSATLAEQHFASLKGNLPMTLYLIPFAWAFGGFAEEFVYRGFIMTRIGQAFGATRAAWAIAVFLQAIPFALGHQYQGPVGMFAVFIGALITGGATVLWGRNLWPAMIEHGLQDTIGFLALYAGLAHA
ncbi:MAG: CPBP family intramembrane glutamic endopeptidase [Alphaproteobacteria bacterium]